MFMKLVHIVCIPIVGAYEMALLQRSVKCLLIILSHYSHTHKINENEGHMHVTSLCMTTL